MKKTFLILFALMIFVLTGCGKSVSHDSSSAIDESDETIKNDYSSESDSIWYPYDDTNEYSYKGKRYFVEKSAYKKIVEDAEGKRIGELPVGRGSWIAYSHYICGININDNTLRIADLDKNLDECIIYENNLSTYFSDSEFIQSKMEKSLNGFLCATNGWVYYSSRLTFEDGGHYILMRVRYDGSKNEVISDGQQYEFAGANFKTATHLVDGVIYTPVYDNKNYHYSYGKIIDNTLSVVECESDYYFSFFKSDWVLK